MSGKMPENWRFIVELPPRNDCEATVERRWDVPLAEGVDFEGQTFRFPEACSVVAVLQWLESSLLSVRLSLSASILGECARCLAETSLAIQDDLMYLYHLRAWEWDKDTSSQTDEGFMPVEVEGFGRTIDLADQVWETLLLLLPSKLLCGEDCRGICPECGADLNRAPCACVKQDGDPRFDALRSFVHDGE